ncbi:Microbial collagenase precursor [Sodalis glossinidius str. 'morsitans']|uniref:Microbial collagenase n=1 Tax=Sodalis glossinidius (strain morsitans) TaxID=343509 RepID=A0A193QK34_SODGM|nr:Microbial collagenase precursor [Sodalis glossinidius str. 'morsitans']
MYFQATLASNNAMASKQFSTSNSSPAPSSPTTNIVSSSVATSETPPSPATAHWEPRIHYRTTRSLSTLDESGTAKATEKSVASPSQVDREQLMKDLRNNKELFLKTSYGHSPQKLLLTAQMLEEDLKKPDKDITALRLLTKYIESDYKRVKDNVSPSPTLAQARKAASGALSRLGSYLAAEVPRTAGQDPAMMTLTETWLTALAEKMRQQPKANHLKKNSPALVKLIRFLLLDPSRRIGDYTCYCCFSLLCDLISYVPNPSRDSRFLSRKQTQLQAMISQSITQSLALASASPQNTYALDHLRRAVNAFTAMTVREKFYHPNGYSALLAQHDQMLAEWMRPYQNLPAHCSLREDIRGVLLKYVEDTGRYPEDYPAYAFHGLFKLLKESDVLPYAIPLPLGGRMLSQHKIDPAAQQRITVGMQSLINKFCSLFGMTPVADDISRPLDIIVLSDRAHYERYGHYPFRIDTNNGGIYIEGQPQDPRNQPRVYVYCRDGEIENFLHEIVHYLDGRFICYGNNAYLSPERITFWQEGLAEFLSGKNRALAMATLQRAPVYMRPSLDEIVDIDIYSANGHTDRLYVWPYFVFDYLDSDPERRTILFAMAKALRQPNHGAEFASVLADFVTRHGSPFNAWLNKQAEVANAG